MKKINAKGKNIEEATENGLKILGLTRDQVEVATINEGKPGVLGVFGGEEAEVEIKQIVSKEEDAKDVLQNIINKLGWMAVSEIEQGDEGSINLDIKGEDLGMAIGKGGDMLRALQTIVSNIVSRNFKERVRVYVNAGGYREKHEKAIQRLAADAAADVVESGQEKILPPMPAADRRLMHLALQENDKVKTYSTGVGKERRLVIAPNTDATA